MDILGPSDAIVSKILYYLLLFLVLFVSSIVIEKFPKNFAVGLIFSWSSLAAIATGMFFTRINFIQPALSDNLAFYAATQIGMAHAIVSTFVLWLVVNSIYLTCLLIGYSLSFLIYGVFNILGKLLRMSFERITSLLTGLVVIALLLVLLVGVPYGWYLLLIENPRLQILLFGHHDPNLGWNLPTTFAFSILTHHVQTQVEVIRNDPLFGILVVQVGIFITVAIKVGGFLGAIQKFKEIWRGQKQVQS